MRINKCFNDLVNRYRDDLYYRRSSGQHVRSTEFDSVQSTLGYNLVDTQLFDETCVLVVYEDPKSSKTIRHVISAGAMIKLIDKAGKIRLYTVMSVSSRGATVKPHDKHDSRRCLRWRSIGETFTIIQE